MQTELMLQAHRHFTATSKSLEPEADCVHNDVSVETS